MIIFLSIVGIIIWLNIGILASRNMDDFVGGAAGLETLPLSFRILSILIAPITLLIFERHVFYRKAK
jgi:hypothetical protein